MEKKNLSILINKSVISLKPKILCTSKTSLLLKQKYMPNLLSSTMHVSTTNISSQINKLLDQQIVYKNKILFPYLLSIPRSQQLCPIQRLNSKIRVWWKKLVIRVHKLGCYNTISQKRKLFKWAVHSNTKLVSMTTTTSRVDSLKISIYTSSKSQSTSPTAEVSRL